MLRGCRLREVVWVGGGVKGWRIRGRGAYLAAIRRAKALQARTNNQNRRQIAACRSVSRAGRVAECRTVPTTF
jgi:hypothetical protein